MHKKVLQNTHFKNRFALQTDGEIGQSDRFETAPPNQNKDGIKYTIYKYDLFPDERIYHARVLQISHYLIPIVGAKYTQ